MTRERRKIKVMRNIKRRKKDGKVRGGNERGRSKGR